VQINLQAERAAVTAVPWIPAGLPAPRAKCLLTVASRGTERTSCPIACRTKSQLSLVPALSARVGLWGNHAYEATYAQVFQDDRGDQLTGRRRYSISFTELPPVRAFWSLTMYDVPDYYLIANPIGRYSIGDRTPGLRYGPDGSLTITIQAEPPADEIQRANWLPAPRGDFRPIMRLYEPGPAILNGAYILPAIHRLD